MMNSQEVETASRLGLDLVVQILEDNALGMIRWKQAADGYPDFGMSVGNPDFAAYARAFGGHGETVEETAQFLPAYERALASSLPSILHVKVDPEAITPTTTLAAIRAQALDKRGSV